MVLTNGREIKGVLIEETETLVTLEQYGIVMQLRKTEIADIQRMKREDRKQELKRMRAPRPHEEEFYPEQVRPFYRSVRGLDSLEADWKEALNRAEEKDRAGRGSAAKVRQLDRELLQTRQRINRLPPLEQVPPARSKALVDTHNMLVRRLNQLAESRQRVVQQAQTSARDAERWAGRAAEAREKYVTAAKTIGVHWAHLSKNPPGGATEAERWMQELQVQLEQHPAVLHATRMSGRNVGPLTASGQRSVTVLPDRMGHYSVPVLLNGVMMQNMMVDTGATTSLIPESVGMAAGARKLGPPVQSKVADGRLISVVPAMLDVVEIYGQKIGPVYLGLLPDSPEVRITNLLGMNVLSEIPMSLTPGGLKLSIRPDTADE